MSGTARGTATPERRPSLPLSIDLPSSVFLTARGFDTNPASPTPPAPVTPTPVHALSVSSGGEDAGPRSDSDGEDDLGGFVVVGGLPSPVVARLHVPVTERDLACTAPGEWLSDVVVNAFMFRLQQRDAHRHAPSLESSLSGASSTFARTGTRDDVPSALASAGRALAGSVSRLLSRSGSWGSPGGRGAGRRPWVEGRSQGVTPSVHVWNSFFLTQLAPPGRPYDYPAVRQWTGNRALRAWGQPRASPLACDVIIAPSHHDAHWALAMVDLAGKRLLFLDSAGRRGDAVMAALAQWVDDEWAAQGGSAGSSPRASEWPRLHPEGVPRQTDSGDCGVFALAFADMLCQGMEPWNPTPSNGHVINNTDAPWHGCDWSGPAMRRAREWVREVIVQGFI